MASTNPTGETDMAAFEAAIAAVDVVDGPDAASARRIALVLRREQAARDGRSLGRAWQQLAGRIERDFPSEAPR